jgi:PAS domain S-box-containing protein
MSAYIHPQVFQYPKAVVLDLEKVSIQKKHRCKHCNKLLGIEQVVLPSFDIKCVRCGHLNSVIMDYSRQVIITDKDGVILYINEQVVTTTGYSSEEILGKTPALWGNQMNKEFYSSLWNTIAKEKRAVVVSVTNKRKDGSLYPAILRISPMLDVDGNVEFFIGMETMEEEVVSTTETIQ